MKRKIIIGMCIILSIVLLFPIPYHLKDGGTVEYKAILYSIQKVHRLNPDMESEKEYVEGTIVKILDIELFNNVQ